MKRIIEIVNVFVVTANGAKTVRVEGTFPIETASGVRDIAIRLSFPKNELGFPKAFEPLFIKGEDGTVKEFQFPPKEGIDGEMSSMHIHKGHRIEVDTTTAEARLGEPLVNRDRTPVTLDIGGRTRVPMFSVMGIQGPCLKFTYVDRRPMGDVAPDTEFTQINSVPTAPKAKAPAAAPAAQATATPALG